MPERFLPRHFWEVGELLLEEEEEGDGAASLWNQVEDARCRTSVSRAYYAVLLRLKERLLSEARYELPRAGANVLAREGVTGVLTDSHELSVLFRRLWSFRTRSDYHLGTGYPPSVADDRLDDAKQACALVDSLTADELRDIASVIRTESARRRG